MSELFDSEQWLTGARRQTRNRRATAVEVFCPRSAHCVLSVHPWPHHGPFQAFVIWFRPARLTGGRAAYQTELGEGAKGSGGFVVSRDLIKYLTPQQFDRETEWLPSSSLACMCSAGTVPATSIVNGAYRWLGERQIATVTHPRPIVVRLTA